MVLKSLWCMARSTVYVSSHIYVLVKISTCPHRYEKQIAIAKGGQKNMFNCNTTIHSYLISFASIVIFTLYFDVLNFFSSVLCIRFSVEPCMHYIAQNVPKVLTFSFNAKCSLLGFYLGHGQLFNSVNPQVK